MVNNRYVNIAKHSLEKYTDYQDAIRSLAFSIDGSKAAFGSRSKIMICNSLDFSNCSVLDYTADEINAIAFSPDGKSIAATYSKNEIRIWDLLEPKKFSSIFGHGYYYMLEYSPDGQYIVAGGEANSRKDSLFIYKLH